LGKEIDILVIQALNFIQQNKEVVEHSALQVYCSALGFTIKDTPLLEHHRDAYKCPKVVVQSRLLCDPEPPIKTGPSPLDISPDGRFIVTVGRDQSIELWIASTGDPHTFRFHGHRSEVTSLAFSLDSQTLVSGSTDGQLRFWSLTTGVQIHLIQTTGMVTQISFSHSGSYLATISSELGKRRTSVLRLWNIPPITEDGDISLKFTYKEAFIKVAFSSDSKLLAAATEVGSFEIHGTSTGTLMSSGNAATKPSSIALSPDGGRLAISDGVHIQLWDVKDVPMQIACISLAVTEEKHALSISHNGKYLLYGSTVWDIEAMPPTLWSGLRLPTALQRYAKGPGSLLSYEGGWIRSAHPQGPIVEIPS
jgi:WD40 repeat protein